MNAKQISIVLAIMLAFAGVVALTSDASDAAAESSSGYPVTITTYVDYNGNTADITFEKAPERIVVGCNTALNLLLYLGYGDKIVGAYYDEEAVWDDVADEYAKLCERIGAVGSAKHLSGNIDTATLLSWQPDLVIGWVSWNDSGLGSESFFNENGCNVMSLNTMTSSSYRNVEMMKVDYQNIGKILGCEEKALALYGEIVATIDAVTAKMAGKDALTYALVDGAVNTEKGTVWCYKNSNFIASVLNGMGMQNAFPNGGTVSLADVYQTIGTTDIDVIIYITYGSVTYEKSLASWKADEDLAKCAAIVNGHTIEMKLSASYGSSPELLDVMETVYDYVCTITNYPVTITTFVDYNGNTADITFTQVPERVVVGCNTALNLLLYLGYGDNIVGAYYDEEEVWSGVADEYAKLCERIGAVGSDKHLSGNIDTATLLSWQPDLVIGWVSWNDSGLGSEAFFNENGCNVMSLNTMTSSAYRNVEMMATDYQNIGKIFNCESKAAALYDEIVATIDAISAKMAGKETITYALVDGAVNTEKGTVWCYKDSNFIASVLNGMGMKNAFPNGGTVSLANVYEVIGTSDIDLVIYITYGNVTYEKSLASWKADEDLSKCAAIVNDHTIDMKLSCSYGSSPELLDVMETVYDYVDAMTGGDDDSGSIAAFIEAIVNFIVNFIKMLLRIFGF